MAKENLIFKHLGVTPAVGKAGKASVRPASSFKGKAKPITKFHPPKIKKPY